MQPWRCVLKRLESAVTGSGRPLGYRRRSRWREEIEQALQQADAVIFLISQPRWNQDEVYRELARAIELGKAIVPLRLDQAPLYGVVQGEARKRSSTSSTTRTTLPKNVGQLLAALRHARRMPHRKEEPAKAEPEPPEPRRRKRAASGGVPSEDSSPFSSSTHGLTNYLKIAYFLFVMFFHILSLRLNGSAIAL